MPKDKQKHLLAGLAISLLAGPFLYLLLVNIWPAVAVMSVGLFCLTLAALVGAIKEVIWDQLLKRGAPEWLDFWATVLGGFLGFIILNLAG